jgi:hypothetical protein
MKKQRILSRDSSRPVDSTGRIVQLESDRLGAIRGGTGVWKLGNKEWNDDWLAPT